MSQETSVVDTIFGTIGNIFDGAQSLFGDYLEFDLLKSELEAQGRGTSSAKPSGYTQPAPQTTSSGGSGGNNSMMFMLGAAILALVGFMVLSD